jgi:hypothetical protein
MIDPQAATVDAPILAADATRVGSLVDQARVVPRHGTARPVHVAALAGDAIAMTITVVLGTSNGSGAREKNY